MEHPTRGFLYVGAMQFRMRNRKLNPGVVSLLTSAKYLSIVVLCLLLGPRLALAACSKTQPGWMWNYEGAIADTHRIRMTLIFGASEITGVYFYASQLKDIPLRGRMIDGTRVMLEETDADGAVSARFEAEFPVKDPGGKFGDSELQCEVIRGTWSKAGNAAGLPVYLSMESGTAGTLANRYAALGVDDPEKLHRNTQAFWLAVKRDDRKAVSALIRYPIRIDTAAGRRRYAAAQNLLADYELIFTPGFREAIASGLPRNMFVRSEGAMLGSGQVWFGADGRVTELNNYLAAKASPVPAPRATSTLQGGPADDDPPVLKALRQGMPPDAGDFIRRVVTCNHWAGEEPYDAERRAQIAAAVSGLRCRELDRDESILRKRYAGKSDVLRRIGRARQTPN